MAEVKEGCSIDYRGDSAVVTTVFRLQYAPEPDGVGPIPPARPLSQGAARLRDEVEKYLCACLGPHNSRSGQLLKPRRYQVRYSGEQIPKIPESRPLVPPDA